MVGIIILGQRIAFFEGQRPSEKDARRLLGAASAADFAAECNRLRITHIGSWPPPQSVKIGDIGWRVLLDLPPEWEAEVIFGYVRHRREQAKWPLLCLRAARKDIAVALQAYASKVHDATVELVLTHPLAAERLTQEHRDFVQSCRSDSVETIASKAASAAGLGLDAASLIFYHSLLDSAVSDLCRISIVLDPESWRQAVADAEVKLSDLTAATASELVIRALRVYARRLRRESLPNRIDKLLSKCSPRRYPELEPYSYDRGAMATADTMRHSIIHGEGLGDEIENIGPILDFLRCTGIYLERLVADHYGLDDPIKRDWEFLSQLPPEVKAKLTEI